jgi:hypothetical protein
LSPRELAISFVDQQQYFVSEASVYRLLKAHGLITSPAFILRQAVDRFAQPTSTQSAPANRFQCAIKAKEDEIKLSSQTFLVCWGSPMAGMPLDLRKDLGRRGLSKRAGYRRRAEKLTD